MEKAETIAKLQAAIRRFKKTAAEARKRGVYVGDRDLVSCPRCGLFEDVRLNGILITSWIEHVCVDTGLRFIEDQRDREMLVCPACGCDAVPDMRDETVPEG